MPFYHYGMERIQCKARGEVVPITFGANMHVVEGADHGFHVLKRSGRSDDEVVEELASTISAWARGVAE